MRDRFSDAFLNDPLTVRHFFLAYSYDYPRRYGLCRRHPLFPREDLDSNQCKGSGRMAHDKIDCALQLVGTALARVRGTLNIGQPGAR